SLHHNLSGKYSKMAKQTFIYCSLLAIVIFWALFSSAQKKTLTVELIHHDSPRSPLYNPLHTVSDRLNAAFLHSISRSRYFSTKTDIQSGLIGNSGDYYMTISISTPATKVLAVADTGSDLTWIQCKSCQQCYKQNSPIFDKSQSSTYKTESCDSTACHGLSKDNKGCDESRNICKYQYYYGDNSFSKGEVATETLTIDSSSASYVSFPSTVIGCGYNNVGTFAETGSGIVSLGGGPLSLILQVGSSIGKKFSYCLSHTSSTSNETSFLNLGTNTIPSIPRNGSVVLTTPLVTKAPNTYYYQSPLATLSFCTQEEDDTTTTPGNIIIDSGTTFTFLESGFYGRVVAAVEKTVIRGKRVSDPQGLLPHCFEDKAVSLPKITMHFTGADVKLSRINAFLKTSEDTVCLSMLPATGISIYGNLIQLGFLVEYDLEAKTVSFQHFDCTTHL
ncbi:unnamed protein product, partial [Thlaspi arvense]